MPRNRESFQPARRFLRRAFSPLVLCLVLASTLLWQNASADQRVARAQATRVDGFGMGSSIHLRVGAGRIAEFLDRQQEMGIGWTREEIPWGEVDMSDGQFRWAYEFGTTPRDFPLLLDELEQRDIEMVALLTYGPWYPTATPQELLDHWAIYVQAVVDQFGDRIDYWEIQNEMNSPFFWGKVVAAGQDASITPDPALYARMLQIAYRIIKEHDPDDVVVLGGLIYHLNNDCDATNPFVYLGELQAAGAWDDFDVIAIHPYRGTWPEEFVSRNRAYDPGSHTCLGDQVMSASMVGEIRALHEMAQLYGDKPIWVTEVGWWQVDLEIVAGYRHTSPSIIEADFLVRTYTALLSEPGVERVFWYTQYDDPNVPGFTLDAEGQHALGLLSEALTGSEPLGQFQGQDDRGGANDDDVYEYRFTRDDQLIIVVWKARGGDESRAVNVTGLTDYESVLFYNLESPDLLPESGTELAVQDGTVTFDLTERPVFLIAEQPNLLDEFLAEIERRISAWWEEQKAKLEAWWAEQQAELERQVEEQAEETRRNIEEWMETELERVLRELCGAAWLPVIVPVALWLRRRARSSL